MRFFYTDCLVRWIGIVAVPDRDSCERVSAENENDGERNGLFFLGKGAKWLSLRGRSTEQLATGFRWKEREYEGNQKLLHHCSYRSR